MAVEDMSDTRWRELMREETELTDDEIEEGWHFCWDWDGLLIHPDMPESQSCNCVARPDDDHGESS